jgi:hypothetical protein
MTEIYKNTSHYVYFDIINSTASGTPTANLVRTNGTTALAVSAVSPTPANVTQSWKAYVPLSETTVEDTVQIVWSAVVGGETATKVGTLEIVTPYLTPEELAARYNWSFNSADSNYKPRQDVIDAERIARFIINAYTKKKFGEKIGTVVAYGQNTDTLTLGTPIVSISKMYQNGELVIDGSDFSKFGYGLEITETGVSVRVLDPDFTDIAESESIRVTPLLGGAAFRQGWRYSIEGVFGYQFIPTDIEDATAMLVNDYVCRDALWRARYINKIEMRDWKFTFEKEAFRGTGNLIVDQMLANYRDLGIFVI